MEAYLIFFGKSQGFTFYAFSEKGFVPDFETVIPDFDMLESRLFNIDHPDVAPMLAKYKFKCSDTNFSLLKLYSYAQAAAGNRVEGSIYGIAFLSSRDIEVSAHNIKILDSLKGYFSDMVLINKKFKKEDFQVEAEAIWSAFARQIGFSTFGCEPVLSLSQSATVKAFGLSSLQHIPKDLEEKQFQSNKMYFSEDKKYLERIKNKWRSNVELFMENEKHQFIQYDEQVSTIAQPTIEESNSIQISDLKEERNRLKKQVTRLKRKVKHLMIVLMLLLIGLMGISAAYLFADSALGDSKATEQGYVQPDFSAAQAAFNNHLIDSIIVDSSRVSSISVFLEDVRKYRTQSKKENKEARMASILSSGQMLMLDSGRVREKLK